MACFACPALLLLSLSSPCHFYLPDTGPPAALGRVRPIAFEEVAEPCLRLLSGCCFLSRALAALLLAGLLPSVPLFVFASGDPGLRLPAAEALEEPDGSDVCLQPLEEGGPGSRERARPPTDPVPALPLWGPESFRAEAATTTCTLWGTSI